MKNILIYTFRTFPWQEELKSLSKEIFVFKNFKKDIHIFKKKIETGNYDLILGIAKANKKSVFETKGVNRFKKGHIEKDGIENFPLYFPINGYESIDINHKYTTSFCNWSIYKVGDLIYKKNCNIKHMFIHILEDDISVLKGYLTSEQYK